MPVDLAALLEPGRCALVTSECQNGVIGPESALPELAAAARESVLPNGRALADAARGAGVPVVHCVAGRRADNRGSNRNGRIFAAMLRAPFDVDGRAAQVVEEFAVAPSDLLLSRLHGLSPMSGTGLDPILRNLGVTSLVVVGVSVNIAVTNLVMDAVNLGYQVVLPRDAVAGVPGAYADAVIDNTLALIATVVRTADVLGVWSR